MTRAVSQDNLPRIATALSGTPCRHRVLLLCVGLQFLAVSTTYARECQPKRVVAQLWNQHLSDALRDGQTLRIGADRLLLPSRKWAVFSLARCRPGRSTSRSILDIVVDELRNPPETLGVIAVEIDTRRALFLAIPPISYEESGRDYRFVFFATAPDSVGLVRLPGRCIPGIGAHDRIPTDAWEWNLDGNSATYIGEIPPGLTVWLSVVDLAKNNMCWTVSETGTWVGDVTVSSLPFGRRRGFTCGKPPRPCGSLRRSTPAVIPHAARHAAPPCPPLRSTAATLPC